MATFADDFVRLRLMVGQQNIPLQVLGLEWPPPERLTILDGGGVRGAVESDPAEHIMKRIRMSEITDEQREGMTHVARGAEYLYEVDV